MRSILVILFFMLIAVSAKSQKFQPGRFVDNKGATISGLIRLDPSGKGPVKNEAFFEYKEDEKMNPVKLSASEVRSVIVGADSLVIAHPPGNSSWAGKELDFVKVELDEEVKLYVGKGGSGGGSRIKPGFSGGLGMGSGGYGGLGGGVGITLGSGGGGGRDKGRATYYFGANTAEMQPLTPINFKDIMSDIMGDEPEVVDQIQQNKFSMANIDKLIAYFKKVKAARQGQ